VFINVGKHFAHSTVSERHNYNGRSVTVCQKFL